MRSNKLDSLKKLCKDKRVPRSLRRNTMKKGADQYEGLITDENEDLVSREFEI